MSIKLPSPITSLHETRRFVSECLVAVGVPNEHADMMGLIVSEADRRGLYSQGMNRLEKYVRDIQSGLYDCKATPQILSETDSTAWVDGRNGLGPVVGNFCMDLAIKKATACGVGWVVAKGCNHYGYASAYSSQALKVGMIGFTSCNSCPVMVPTGATEAALGTNPISVSAPALNNDSFVLDMSTTVVSRGKVEVRQKEGTPLVEGWALNQDGKIETNPEKALENELFLPLGGPAVTGGHKGTGLGIVVDMLTGVLGGAHYGPYIKHWGDTSRNEDLGQCFVVINPQDFAPGFQTRLSDLMNTIRKLRPVNPDKPVLVAGDAERLYMAAVAEAGGVHYVSDQHRLCDELAKELGVKPLLSVLTF